MGRQACPGVLHLLLGKVADGKNFAAVGRLAHRGEGPAADGSLVGRQAQDIGDVQRSDG